MKHEKINTTDVDKEKQEAKPSTPKETKHKAKETKKANNFYIHGLSP